MTNKNDQTPNPSSTISELATKGITIFESLTFEEERDRLRLERQVERSFYQAGLALQALRDQRLYRSTHKTFAEYCQDRFGFTRRKSDYLIAAIEIVDNLSENNCSQISQEREQIVLILPTKESQVRPLKSLPSAELQRKAWRKAVEKAQGVPTAKIVQPECRAGFPIFLSCGRKARPINRHREAIPLSMLD